MLLDGLRVQLAQNVCLRWATTNIVVVMVFVVFVERLHLLQDLISDLMQGSHLVWSDRNLNVIELAHYRLKLHVVDTVQRFDHQKIILLLLVFLYRCLDRCKMFLVAHVDVV